MIAKLSLAVIKLFVIVSQLSQPIISFAIIIGYIYG